MRCFGVKDPREIRIRRCCEVVIPGTLVCPKAPSHPLLEEEIRSNPGIFLDPELKARCEVIADLGDSNALYGRIWDQVKAAR